MYAPSPKFFFTSQTIYRNGNLDYDCMIIIIIRLFPLFCSRLGLHLPHKVYSKQSKAKWISDIEELHITLLLNREYDFINQ